MQYNFQRAQNIPHWLLGTAQGAHTRHTMRRVPIDYINDGRTAYITVSMLDPSIFKIQITPHLSDHPTTALPKTNG